MAEVKNYQKGADERMKGKTYKILLIILGWISVAVATLIEKQGYLNLGVVLMLGIIYMLLIPDCPNDKEIEF